MRGGAISSSGTLAASAPLVTAALSTQVAAQLPHPIDLGEVGFGGADGWD
jgi:hypothetical protein